MFQSKYEEIAILSKRILSIGFILSILTYIVLFIAPTLFELQVVVAPRKDDYNKKSLYYLKHVTPNDIKVEDVLVFIDDSNSPKTTTVTHPVVKSEVPTMMGRIDYAQTLGIKKLELKALGNFYAFSLSENGRRLAIAYVVIFFMINYLLSYFVPKQHQYERISELNEIETSEEGYFDSLPPREIDSGGI